MNMWLDTWSEGWDTSSSRNGNEEGKTKRRVGGGYTERRTNGKNGANETNGRAPH